MLLIYSTHKNTEEAEKIVSGLLNEKLIACATMFPVHSQYIWKGEIEKSEEVVTFLKTKNENWGKVKKYIEENHSYETPCIIKIGEVEASQGYEDWINSETI